MRRKVSANNEDVGIIRKLENYEKMFIDKGYKPLEAIKDTKAKIKCCDEYGFLYWASYDMVRDKRTKSLDRFKKQNIFKPYNMRLYASIVQDGAQILSTDEELMTASERPVRFICPKCGREYSKRWFHWIAQKDNCHFCQICSRKESSYEFLVDKWLGEHGFVYSREYWFNDCRDKRVLPFDFAVQMNNGLILIEVDGCQHYYENPMFTNFTLEERRRKDEIKTSYCEQNGYTLLRIPFWDFSRDTYLKKLSKTFLGQPDELL